MRSHAWTIPEGFECHHLCMSRGCVTPEHIVAFRAPAIARFTVRDNGVRMTKDRPEEASNAGHFGLVGMRERVESESGPLIFNSAPGTATTIRFNFSDHAHTQERAR